MSMSVTLPRVVGTRLSAHGYLRDLPTDLSGQDIELDCRRLVDGTASFADEVVKIVLKERNARTMVAVGPGRDFADDLQTAAHDHGVADAFSLERVTESVAN